MTADPRRMRSVRAGDGGEDGLRRGDREVVAMVFADPEEVEAETVSEDGFLDHVADHLCLAEALAGGGRR